MACICCDVSQPPLTQPDLYLIDTLDTICSSPQGTATHSSAVHLTVDMPLHIHLIKKTLHWQVKAMASCVRSVSCDLLTVITMAILSGDYLQTWKIVACDTWSTHQLADTAPCQNLKLIYSEVHPAHYQLSHVVPFADPCALAPCMFLRRIAGAPSLSMSLSGGMPDAAVCCAHPAMSADHLTD